MKRFLIPLIAVFAAGLALAATVTVTWDNPTENTDNSAIPASGAGSISTTRIEWGSCVGTAFGTKAGELLVQGAAETAQVPNLAPGTWCFRSFTRNTYGQESVASNVAIKTIAAPTPKPPTNFSVN